MPDRYRPKENRKTVFLHRVAEMHQIEWADEAVRIGAGVTIEQLAGELERRLPSLDETRTSCLKALMSQCRFLGNHQIRSVATVGGGIVNFNHYSDLIPIWVVSERSWSFVPPTVRKSRNFSSHMVRG